MYSWVYYSLLIIIIYTIWTVTYEVIIKNHDNCLCVPLKMYIITGIFAVLFYLYHINTECKHGNTINIFNTTSIKVILMLAFISFLILLSNRYWLKALIKKGNSGYVAALTNTYIILVTFISAYMYNNSIEKQHVAGIFAIIIGSAMLAL